MKSVTVLAREHGLSRTTLLYYDRIGLLSPTYRAGGGTRLYDAGDHVRLARIVTYRRAGIPLHSIKRMLDAAPMRVNERLEHRLNEIQQQVGALRTQQRFIVEMLKDAVLRGEGPARTRDQWVQLLRACDFSPADMHNWHVAMERDDPSGHARFLRRIGLTTGEAAHIREHSRAACGADDQSASSASAAKP